MDQELKKKLSQDSDGLLTYEYIANHMGLCDHIMDDLTENMIVVDSTGQFLVSGARYLNAIDPERYAPYIRKLAEAAIARDREHRYIPDLIESLYGADYEARADELNASDDIFRRLYKRIHPPMGM